MQRPDYAQAVQIRASRVVAIAIIAAAVAALSNCSRISYAVVNGPAHVGWYDRKANIAYGKESRQALDVYAPVGAFNRPIVVFWYGGIWTKGAKEDYRFVGAALANAGYVAVLPDYRLYPQVRYPTFVEDGALALKWAHEHAAEIGGSPRSLFLMGHSAGAHIAASLALDPRYLQNVGGSTSWVRGWIGLAGPYELEKRIPLLDEIFRAPYTSADWQPVLLAREHAPPALLLQGTDDYIVRVKEAVHLDQKLRAVDVPVECHIYDAVDHFKVVSALSVPFRGDAPSLQDVSRFIDRIVGADESVYLPCPNFPDLDQAAIGIDPHPVARLDDLQRIAIELGDRGHAHDDAPQRDLRGHLVEDHGLRRRAGEAAGVEHAGPARRALRARANENPVLEADTAQLVTRLDDRAEHRIHPAPA